MVIAVAVLIHRDIRVLQPDLALARERVRTAQLHMPLANRFDLGSHQRDTRLHRALDLVIVVRLPVDADHLDALLTLRLLCFLVRRLLRHL